MSPDVTTLAPSASLREAIETFESDRISGAPVVDSAGNLIGVLSASDLVKTEHVAEARLDAHRGEYYMADPLADWDDLADVSDYSAEVFGEQTVSDWMTTTVISVAPDATIKQVCQVMIEQSVHRLLVVENGRTLGIVTTTDLVRAVAERL